MAERQGIESEVGRSLEGAIEGLRWCRDHLQDRGAAIKLQELQVMLGALALAMDYEMDGETEKGRAALEKSVVKARRLPNPHWDQWEMFGH